MPTNKKKKSKKKKTGAARATQESNTRTQEGRNNLPNGWETTPEEVADDFLTKLWPRGEELTSQLKIIASLNEQLAEGRSLSTSKRKEIEERIIDRYANLGFVGSFSSDQAFGQLDPERQLSPLLHHMNSILEQSASDSTSTWCQQGSLDGPKMEAFVCLAQFSKKDGFVKCIFKEKTLDVLAAMMNVLGEESFPAFDCIRAVVEIVHQSIKTLSKDFDLEKAFKYIHKSGMLHHALRLITYPSTDPQLTLRCVKLLDNLAACPLFLSKRFEAGTPSNLFLSKLCSGELGYKPITKRLPSVTGRLNKLMKVLASTGSQISSCSRCGNHAKLFDCEGCHLRRYCSKDCQRIDWPQHKLFCVEVDFNKQEIAMFETTTKLLSEFAQHNYPCVMDGLSKAMNQCGHRVSSPTDLLLELDFEAGQDGIAPALANPPRLKFGRIVDYMEGGRPAMPDWLGKSTHPEYERHITKTINAFKKTIKSKSDTDLLVFMRGPSGPCHVAVLDYPCGDDGKPPLGSEKVEAYSRFFIDHTASPDEFICAFEEEDIKKFIVHWLMQNDSAGFRDFFLGLINADIRDTVEKFWVRYCN